MGVSVSVSSDPLAKATPVNASFPVRVEFFRSGVSVVARLVAAQSSAAA